MTRSKWVVGLGGATAALMVLASGAHGQLTKDEQKCIDQYNNKTRLVSQTAGKDYRKCVKNATKGKELNPENCVATDGPGKIAGKTAKVDDLFAPGGKCSGSEPIQQGAATGNQAHIDGPQDLTRDLFGDPITNAIVTPGKQESKCVDKAILRAVQAFTEKVKTFRKCKKDGMKALTISGSTSLEAECMTPTIPDPKGKIAKKVGKIGADVTKNCASIVGSLPTLFPGLDGSCHASDAALTACIESAVECRVCQTLNSADGMGRNCDEFDDGSVNGSCAGGLTQHACALAGGGASKIELNVEALPVPLSFNMNGDLTVGLGASGGGGIAPASCAIDNIDPINIPSIGFVCIAPAGGCPLGQADCDGGSQLGIDLVANGNIGACTGNANCESLCQTHCAGIAGHDYLSSGCTGYCTEGSQMACNEDQDCIDASEGACNGPDPVGSNNNICQCQCLQLDGPGPNGAGTLQCQLGADLVVEQASPCNGTDVTIDVGQACIPVTTSTATTVITNANFGTTTLGPFSNTGSAIACATVDTSTTTGLAARGVVNFFGSALGDIAVELFAQCQ